MEDNPEIISAVYALFDNAKLSGLFKENRYDGI